jgi:hypothetical protein
VVVFIVSLRVRAGANNWLQGAKTESLRTKEEVVCAVMFHFANAGMLPLFGELLAKGQGRSSMLFIEPKPWKYPLIIVPECVIQE